MYCLYTKEDGPMTYGKTPEDCIANFDLCGADSWDGVMIGRIENGSITPVEVE